LDWWGGVHPFHIKTRATGRSLKNLNQFNGFGRQEAQAPRLAGDFSAKSGSFLPDWQCLLAGDRTDVPLIA